MRLFICAAAAIWAFDVEVNLGLLPGVFFPDPLFARVQDFLGLLLLSGQIALGTVAAALAGGALITRVSRCPAATESAALLAAALSTLEILGQASIAWGLVGGEITRALGIAAAGGIAVWVVLRFALGLGSVERWTLGETARFTLFPPLVVGYVNLALAGLLKGGGRLAPLHGSIALLWVGVWFFSRRRAGWFGATLRGAPLWFAAVLAAWSCIASAAHGRSGPTASRAPGDVRPHVVLVVLDTVRADHLSRHGYARNTMPALERWADTALVALRAVSPAGWTAEAHASIFSGKPVSLHGIHYGERSFVTRPFDGVLWLPAELGALGYRSLAVTANPLAIPDGVTGFDELLAPRRNPWHASSLAALVDHRSALLRRLSERLRWRMPHVSAEEVVDLVMRTTPEGDKPTFLFVNFLDAHSPYNPPAAALRSLGVRPGRAFERYRSHRELTTMWSHLPESKSRDLTDLYDAELRGIDVQLARLLRWIDERYGGQAVVIVTSDHGEELGEEGRVGHEHGLPQRLLHVPLMIRGPGVSPGARTDVADLRRLHDLLLSLAQGAEPDFATLFEPDEYGVIAERYPSGMDGGPRRPSVSLIEGNRKALGPSAYGFELFDLGSDFSRDVALDGADAAELRQRIDVYWERHRDRREDDTPLSDEQRMRLRSLGYVR